ncbi:hypothetical protein D9M72_222940 [compost metagenome]
MGGELEVEHALGVAGGLLCRLAVAFQQRHLPATCGKAGGSGAACQPRADYQGLAALQDEARAGEPGLGVVLRLTGEQAPAHFPFLAEAAHALDGETGLRQPAAHEAGGGEGREAGSRTGQARQLGEQGGAPHLGVLRRGEAVEKPGVDLRVQLGQAVQGIAHQQGEHHAARGQVETLETGVDRHVLVQQLGGLGRQLRPQGQGASEVVAGEGELLHADEVQPGIGRRALLEQLPGTEEVQPGTESGLADAKASARGQFGEAPGQVIAGDEHMMGFVETRGRREIDVVEFPRQRSALFVPVELGVVKIGHGVFLTAKREC